MDPGDATFHSVPLDASAWDFEADEARFEAHLGRPALYLNGGLAFPRGVELEDGIIECELAVSGDRAFSGVTWHGDRMGNYEAFFIRPHQVGNPDSTQYTPVFNGVFGWQLYHGPGFNSAIRFPIGEWFRMRVVVAEGRATVYVADMARPALVTPRLRLGVARGAIGLHDGGLAGTHFASFSFTPRAALPVAVSEPPPPHGTVPAWLVSDAVPESSIDNVRHLPAGFLAGRRWTVLRAEESGLANLARVNPLSAERNTTLARTTIWSETSQLGRLDIGFSDRIRAFFNGRLLFAGDDSFRSRDYRFLGSIGYWDALFLPLEPGPNDLVLAISEDFGGWGVQARLDDVAAIRFDPS